jgi:hypothetical protein
VPSIKEIRISPPGLKATLIDISASGLLAEWGVALRIGQVVTVNFEGTSGPQSVEADGPQLGGLHDIRLAFATTWLAFSADILDDTLAGRAASDPAPAAVADLLSRTTSSINGSRRRGCVRLPFVRLRGRRPSLLEPRRFSTTVSRLVVLTHFSGIAGFTRKAFFDVPLGLFFLAVLANRLHVPPTWRIFRSVLRSPEAGRGRLVLLIVGSRCALPFFAKGFKGTTDP